MTTITIKVPAEMAQKLKSVSIKKRIPKSQYVRDVLETALKKEKQESSLLDRMKDAVGCFDGPSDLSTNSKYLKGYGKWRT